MDPEQPRLPQSATATGAGQVAGSLAAEYASTAGSSSGMQPAATRRSSAASAPALSALSIPLPTFPVLPPPSVGDPHQTFQTPSQVSAILSLPPPLLMQLARTDSPVEQLHIAEKRGVRSYLSAMAIPPPSPTSLVESIARENAAGFGGTPSSAGDANGHGGAADAQAAAGTTSAGGQGVPPTTSRQMLHVPLSIPLSLPNFTAAASSSSTTTSLPSGSSAVASTSSGGGAATTTSPSSSGQAQLALPLLLGQVFAPPPLTPGVLAPIPGFGSVSSLFAISSTGAAAPLPPDAGSTPTSPTALSRIAFAPSVDAWSLHTASQRAAEGAGTEPNAGTDGGTPGLDVGDLARQIKDWALETQERHVEVQVAEAKAAAVVLAAQVQAQEAADTGTGLGSAAGGLVAPDPAEGTGAGSDTETRMASSSSTAMSTTAERDKDGLRIYAEAYKKQLDALASGYFAQLHRDALQRLEDETRSRAAAEVTATEGARAAGGGAVSEGWSLPQASSSNLTAGVSSMFGSSDTTASSSSGIYSTSDSTAPLSSSQAPTLQSLTTLTSSRSQAEAMHVRASAAAAVAAQVMAAQDLARSAGEKLVELGVDPRKVVEEVGGMVDRTASETSAAGLEEIIDKAVASATSRRGSRDERSTPTTAAGAAAGASAGPSSETIMHRTLSSGAKSDAMSIEDVGQPALPASTSTAAATAPSTISADAALSGAAAATSGQASVADLASLPHADKPPSTARPPTTSTSTGGFDGVNVTAATAGHASAAAEAYPPQPPYGMPGQTTTAAEYAALATPEKRDYLLSYAHQLYSSEPQSPQLLPLLHTLEALHPDHLPTLLLISCVYYSRGELESSLYYNKRLLQIDPSYVSLLVDDDFSFRARRSLTHSTETTGRGDVEHRYDPPRDGPVERSRKVVVESNQASTDVSLSRERALDGTAY